MDLDDHTDRSDTSGSDSDEEDFLQRVAEEIIAFDGIGGSPLNDTQRELLWELAFRNQPARFGRGPTMADFARVEEIVRELEALASRDDANSASADAGGASATGGTETAVGGAGVAVGSGTGDAVAVAAGGGTPPTAAGVVGPSSRVRARPSARIAAERMLAMEDHASRIYVTRRGRRRGTFRHEILRLFLRDHVGQPPHAARTRRDVPALAALIPPLGNTYYAEMVQRLGRIIQQHQQSLERKEKAARDLANHVCVYCPMKKRKLDAVPHLKFHPTTLRQQLLLYFGYMTFDKAGEESADALPLPEAMIVEIKRVHWEIKRWTTNNKHLESTMRDMAIAQCILTDLHWIPGKTKVDRRATIRMILHADMGLYRPGEFLLAATVCLDDEVVRLWPLLDLRTREHWASNDMPYSADPIVSYWIAKCADQPMKMNSALERMPSHFIKEKSEESFEALNYFWPSIVECMGGLDSDRMKYLFDHSFHEAIESSNWDATHFVWRQAPIQYHRSMVSAAHCCGARNAYYAFSKAVENGQYDVVNFIWNKTDSDQHNGMLLAEHAKSFCVAAENGYVEMAKLMWRDTTFNQRFVLLFEQSCAAFRRSCANGHVEIVRLLWQDASVEQRRQILTMCQCEALALACRNGRLNVVKFLLENMGEVLKTQLSDTCMNYLVLSKCISESSSATGTYDSSETGLDGGPILRYIFSSFNEDDQLLHALIYNEGEALKSLLARGEKTNDWEQIRNLLNVFNAEHKKQLRAMMGVDQAMILSAGVSTACIPKSSVTEKEK